MGQLLHGSARTTEAVRRAIQHSEESVRALAGRYGISPTTVQKWRKRTHVSDAPMGRRPFLTTEGEAMVVAFRRHTLLPLDDCLYALQPSVPHLTRSSLHRCLQRHGISRLPALEGDAVGKKRFKAYPIGHFHIGIAQGADRRRASALVRRDRPHQQVRLRAPGGEGHGRHGKRLPEGPHRDRALRHHTILTDNGVQFCHAPHNRDGPTTRYSVHMFDRICREHGIEHRLTKALLSLSKGRTIPGPTARSNG